MSNALAQLSAALTSTFTPDAKPAGKACKPSAKPVLADAPVVNRAPKSAKAPLGAKTAALVSLFDRLVAEVLCLIVAQDIAEAHGLNRTSAGSTFYRWRAARMAGLDAVPASSASAAKALAEAQPKH